MEKKIKARFVDLPAGSEARARPPIPVPDHAETLVSVETDAEMPNTSITIYNKIPRRPERTVGDYRRFVLEQLYHGMLNSRLSEIGQGADAPFTYAYSSTSGLNRSVDGFVRSAQVKSNKIAEAMQILVDEVERVNRHGFTASELERAKKDVARSYEQLETERDKRDGREFAAEILRNFFEGEMMPGIKAERALVADFLGGIELAELNKLAASWGGAANRVVTVSGPPEAASIERDKILAIVDGASRRKLDPYSDDVDRGPLMADKPAPGKIKATKEIAAIGVTVWTLANGVEVVVKPTDFKNDEVLIQASSPGGTSVASDAAWPHARFAGQIVSAAGIGRFDQVQLGKYLTGKVASVNAFVGELEEGLWGNASPADLETAMQMIHQRFVAPRRDPKAFATWQSRMKEFLRNRRLSPQSAFFEDMGAELSSRHPRRLPPTPEAIAAVDLDKALAFYKERFADASDFRFVIVGNVDLATLKPLVETYLGSLPALKRNDKWRDVGVKPPRGVKKFSLDRGVEQKSFVYLAFHGPQRWSKQADNDLTMLVETLQIRLREVMREDMGGVYGVSPFGSISRRPKQERNLSVFFGCDPANVDKLVAAVFDELHAIGKKGIDESYVEKIKTMRLRQREVDLETNRFWSRALGEAFTYGEDPKEILDHKKWVAQVSSKRIKAAARKYGSKKQYFLGVLYPEKKSE
jgi:zinc protease